LSEPLLPRDPFAGLLPPAVERMPVAWCQLRVPGPPPAFALREQEREASAPRERFARRTIQHLDCGAARAGSDHHDRLALVDKVSPHALYDLMLSEVSARPKTTPEAVTPRAAHMLWRTGLGFVELVSDPEVRRDFALAGAQVQLALNCDPNTADRESVQAAKQFHLHLLCWRPEELAPLAHPQLLGRMCDQRMRRQFLDPLAFLGSRIIGEAAAGLELGTDPALAGARWLPDDPAAVIDGRRPLGALLRLPGWQAIGSAGFEDLIRRLHRTLDQTAADLLEAFTGRREPPPPWRRHPLLPIAERSARIDALPLSAGVREGLHRLARGLRDLPAVSAQRLRRATPAARMHCMTLNQPCYGLSLVAAADVGRDARRANATPIDADGVLLIVQTKLFSGTGSAGLLALDGVPSVRLLRGCGAYSAAQWQRRAAFQRAFASYNTALLTAAFGPGCGPVRRLADFERGWI